MNCFNLGFHQRCSDFRRMQGHHSRLLKELPELPWVSPFVRGSGFLHFSVPLNLTPGASLSLFARGHHLVTQPRLDAFLNGYDLYLSLASLLYISPNGLKKNTTKNTGLCRAVDQENPLYFLQHEGNTDCTSPPESGEGTVVGWCGGGVWRFSPGPQVRGVRDGEQEERGDSAHTQLEGLQTESGLASQTS